MNIRENVNTKLLLSPTYNYKFDKRDGYFVRWGATFGDDPEYSPFGPEILDIEVTTICNGSCRFCYKSNTPNGKNMSLSTFKTILDKMPRSLMQCAFGADSSCTSNPDIWKMMEYCRENKKNPIVPNITVADISDSIADRLVNVCGAVAVSRYSNKDLCYNSVQRLISRGLRQTNIHIMVSKETESMVYETLTDSMLDPRLRKLNAIVLLSLKKKGRGKNHTPLTQKEFDTIVKYALDNNIRIGFDSCSCGKFFKAIEGRSDEKELKMLSEPCEAFGIFSSYLSIDGLFFPCSFCEESHEDWMQGIDVTKCEDFIKDVWNHPMTEKWRNIMLERRKQGNYNCPIYEV